MTHPLAARDARTEVHARIKAVHRRYSLLPPSQSQPVLRSSSPRRPGILVPMKLGEALFVAWCAWIGSLMVGSVVVLVLDKSEWRVAVGILSLLIGLLAFVYSMRM